MTDNDTSDGAYEVKAEADLRLIAAALIMVWRLVFWSTVAGFLIWEVLK